MIILGLTGSIGMGKSTTAAMFAARGVPVWDADATVAGLYGPGGAACQPLGQVFPGVCTPGGVDRAVLKAAIARDPANLKTIETIVHPLVAKDRARFLDQHRAQGTGLVVLDIPLLFETGADALCDVTLCVSAPAAVQRARVMARPGMTEALFNQMLAAQMPDAEKRARADHVIETLTQDQTQADIDDLLSRLPEAS